MPGRADAVVLVVLDGWGLAPPGPGNAVEQAQTPVFDELWSTCPHTQLTACGVAVGLPAGQMGNSEVGHMNLGAGAVVKQDLLRIDEAVAAGDLASNDVLVGALEGAGRVHLIGLVSDGGVHSSLEHLEALCDLAKDRGAEPVVHAFTDGRDTSPQGGAEFVARIERRARVASVIGRYFAMDRDKRWDRTQQAYDLLVHGRAEHRAESGHAAVRAAYERGETDEFIKATVVGDEPVTIAPGDSVIAFNFRPDRMRQLTLALCDPAFTDIDRGGMEPVERYVTLTEYDEQWDYAIAFRPARPSVTLPKVLGAAGRRQLHVAETEKYPHVTYFFNGGDEAEQPGEAREAPSPRDVPTYDHKPEMSAAEASSLFTTAWRKAAAAGEPFTFGIINFANPDMVGHTGVIPAAVKAVEAADKGLGEVVAAVRETGGALLVTADHGNADEMLEEDGSPDTAHSLNPVPLVVVADGVGPETPLRGGGVLADVAPTALDLLGAEQPAEMTGRSLLDA
jgi:2,3-bisphosphoglycerate-independent phosphoglycerate mutase